MKARLTAAVVSLALATAIAVPATFALWIASPGGYTYEISTAASFDPTPEACEDVTMTSFVAEQDEDTTFGYTVSGGGEDCQEKSISHFHIPVCFHAELGSETGPVIAAGQPPGWEYSGSDAQQLVKWDNVGGEATGFGPFGGLVFTITVEGKGLETELATAFYKAGPHLVPVGQVEVPACAQESTANDEGEDGENAGQKDKGNDQGKKKDGKDEPATTKLGTQGIPDDSDSTGDGETGDDGKGSGPTGDGEPTADGETGHDGEGGPTSDGEPTDDGTADGETGHDGKGGPTGDGEPAADGTADGETGDDGKGGPTGDGEPTADGDTVAGTGSGDDGESSTTGNGDESTTGGAAGDGE